MCRLEASQDETQADLVLNLWGTTAILLVVRVLVSIAKSIMTRKRARRSRMNGKNLKMPSLVRIGTERGSPNAFSSLNLFRTRNLKILSLVSLAVAILIKFQDTSKMLFHTVPLTVAIFAFSFFDHAFFVFVASKIVSHAKKKQARFSRIHQVSLSTKRETTQDESLFFTLLWPCYKLLFNIYGGFEVLLLFLIHASPIVLLLFGRKDCDAFRPFFLYLATFLYWYLFRVWCSAIPILKDMRSIITLNQSVKESKANPLGLALQLDTKDHSMTKVSQAERKLRIWLVTTSALLFVLATVSMIHYSSNLFYFANVSWFAVPITSCIVNILRNLTKIFLPAVWKDNEQTKTLRQVQPFNAPPSPSIASPTPKRKYHFFGAFDDGESSGSDVSIMK